MPSKVKQSTYVSFAHAARLLGVSERAIRYAVEVGNLPADNLAPDWWTHEKMLRIPGEEIERAKNDPPPWLIKSRECQASRRTLVVKLETDRDAEKPKLLAISETVRRRGIEWVASVVARAEKRARKEAE